MYEPFMFNKLENELLITLEGYLRAILQNESMSEIYRTIVNVKCKGNYCKLGIKDLNK